MVYGRSRRGGLQAVDRTIGSHLRNKILYHDDGQAARGGVMTVLVGKRGTGKTTLEIQIAQAIKHYPNNQRDRSNERTLKPETIIWRGRSYDYWNSLDPLYWEKVQGYKNPKPLYIHNWVGNDHYQFMTDYDGKREELSQEDFNFLEYDTEEELIGNLIEGAINVVYEPSDYILPEWFVKLYKKKNVKFTGEEQKEGAPEKTNPVLKKLKPVEASSSTFWYPFIDRLMKVKPRENYITMILDDSNQLFEEGIRGEKWHMAEHFVASIVDMRRLNISLMMSIHETGLMYYKVRRRADYMIYMRGARPDDAMSRVIWVLPTALPIGSYIVEDPGVEFGLCEFERLERQPPMISVAGCENFS